MAMLSYRTHSSHAAAAYDKVTRSMNLKRIKVKRDEARNILESEEHIEDEESAVKMYIPFRRIIGLTAMGLMTGALLRLAYQALPWCPRFESGSRHFRPFPVFLFKPQITQLFRS
jgi:hypothetical protein